MEDFQSILSIIAAITAPACGFLVWQIKTLYKDLRQCQQGYISLLREVVEALQALENGEE